MAKRDQDVHFLASKEEVERIHEKMDELGIRSMGAYLRKMALDATSRCRIGSTPKRGVGGSNPLWDARKHRCKPFFGVCSVFLFLPLPVILLLLPGDFYTPHDVYLLIELERFSEIC